MELESILKTIVQYYAQNIAPYLVADYQGEAFQRFGLPHIIILGITAFFIFLIILTRRKLDDEGKSAIRENMAMILVFNEIAWYLWQFFYEGTTLLKIIPLHFINILAWLTIFMLFKKSKKLYEIVYLLGTIPALYLLLMPTESIYGFPHSHFFYVLITPAIIFLAPIYMSVVEEDIQPEWKSIPRAILTANIILAIVYGINVYVGTDYLNLLTKPKTSPFPLPSAPLHILYYEGVGIASSLILYIPFLIKDWIDNRGLKTAGTSRLENL